MRNKIGVERFAVLAAVAFLATSPARSQTGKDPRTPEQRVADAEIARRICEGAENAYRAAERMYNEAWILLRDFPTDLQRAKVDDLHERLLEAISDYCECMRSTYSKAKLPLPPDYERLCVRPPAIAPPPGQASIDEKCATARDAYLRARQAWIEAGRPFLGMEAAAMGMEIDRTGRAYCECLKIKYPGRLPSELAKFCDYFDPVKRQSLEPPKEGGPKAFDPPLPPPEPPPGVGGPIRRRGPGWGGVSPPKGSGNTGSPSDPQPIPVPPPAPGAGSGSGGAGTGAGTGGAGTGGGSAVPTPTPTPSLAPPAAPTEVSSAPWRAQHGMTASLAVTVVSHDGSHVAGAPTYHPSTECGELARASSLAIVTASENAFSAMFGSRRQVDCSRIGRTDSFRCEGRFSGFAEADVRATIDPLNVSNGSVQGLLSIAVPGGEIEYRFTGRIQP